MTATRRNVSAIRTGHRFLLAARWVIVVLSTILADASRLHGQSPPATVFSLETGVRIRIHPFGGGGTISGSIDRLSRDTMFVSIDETRRPAILPVTLAAINALDVSAGHQSFVGPGAAVGLLLGAIVTLGYGSARSAGCDDCSSLGVAAPFVAIGTGAIGAFVGMLFSGDRWVPVTLPPRAQMRNPPMRAGSSKI